MQIMTFSSSKGGVGKTTLAYNFGEWLAQQGHQVLMIDADYQANLSSLYGNFSNHGSLLEVFTGGEPEIQKVSEEIDLIPASPFLDKVETLINDHMYQDLMMLKWAKAHNDALAKYDYVIIDTHPEFTWLTKNMIALSDAVFVPIEPSEFGFTQSKNQFDIRMEDYREQSINPRTGVSDIDAQVFYVGNLIANNTKSSRAFREAIDELPEVIGNIEKREIMKTTTLLRTPAFKMHVKESKQVAFMQRLKDAFTEMQQAVDQTGEMK